ncbi:MAG: MarR family transcriptional regulator [Cryobacterium sp.]
MADKNSRIPVLDEQICFALYSASRALTAKYRDLLDPLGLTYPQYLVLLVLWETGPITVTRLGDRLRLDSGTLSPLLRRMEAAGFLTRSRLPHDERSVQVALTPSGSVLRHEARHVTDLVCVATGLELDDLHSLREQITLLGEHIRASN